MRLDQAQRYQLCCYLSWSPCLQCAQELEKFASKHKNLGVHIYTARLYCHWLRYFQKGLYLLWKYQVPVTVMGLQGRKSGAGGRTPRSKGGGAGKTLPPWWLVAVSPLLTHAPPPLSLASLIPSQSLMTAGKSSWTRKSLSRPGRSCSNAVTRSRTGSIGS